MRKRSGSAGPIAACASSKLIDGQQRGVRAAKAALLALVQLLMILSLWQSCFRYS